MIMKDVLVMAWGKTKDNKYIPKQEIEFPGAISIDLESNKIIGKATNFKNTILGITCDIEITKSFSLSLENLEGILKIKGLSFVNEPVTKEEDLKEVIA